MNSGTTHPKSAAYQTQAPTRSFSFLNPHSSLPSPQKALAQCLVLLARRSPLKENVFDDLV